MFAPLQSDTGKQLSSEHSLPDKIDTVVMISPGGKVFTHSDVTLEAFKLMGGQYRILSWLSYIPKVIRDTVYRVIAKYRYKWFGKNETCMIPDPKWKARFLE